MDGVAASGYILPIVKTLELVCGLAFIAGRFVGMTVVLIFPIVVNIVMINLLLMPSGLPIAMFLLAEILFLAYTHRKSYEPLFAAN